MKKKSFTPLILLLLIILAGTFFLVNSSFFLFNNKNSSGKKQNSDKLNVSKLHLFNSSKEKEEQEENKLDTQKGYRPDLYQGLDSVRLDMANGNYRVAENRLKNLLIFYPNDKTTLSLLGGIFYLTGKHDDAIVIFNKLDDLYQKSANVEENLGIQYEAKRDYKMAIKEFSKAIQESQGSSALSFIHLAGLYSILGNKKEAIMYFQKAHHELGEKILAFYCDPVFDNIRNTPEFVLIIHMYLK